MKMQSKEAVDEPLAVNFLLSLLHMEPMCRSIWTTWILLSVRKAQGFFFLLLELSVARGIHASSHHFKQGEKQDWITWGFFFYQKKDDWTELNLPFLLKSCYRTYLHLEVAISMVFIYITVMSTLLLNGDTVMTVMAHCTIGVYAMSWSHDGLHVLTFLKQGQVVCNQTC